MPDWLTILTWALILVVFACLGVLMYVFAGM